MYGKKLTECPEILERLENLKEGDQITIGESIDKKSYAYLGIDNTNLYLLTHDDCAGMVSMPIKIDAPLESILYFPPNEGGPEFLSAENDALPKGLYARSDQDNDKWKILLAEFQDKEIAFPGKIDKIRSWGIA